MLSSYKYIRSDVGDLPSLYTGHTMEGVSSRLSVDDSKPPTYNGAVISDMRGNPIYDHLDQIDRIGKVRRQLASRVADYAKSDFNRSFMHELQSLPKPKK